MKVVSSCLFVSLLAAFAPYANAQHWVKSSASVGVANLAYGGDAHILSLIYNDSDTSDPSQVSLSPLWINGWDPNGGDATMQYTGYATARSHYRKLHVSTGAALHNSFYNPDNPPYFDALSDPVVVDHKGVPDKFYAYGEAAHLDRLSIGGMAGMPGTYGARYVLRVTGNVDGDGFHAAWISIRIGDNAPEHAAFNPQFGSGDVYGEYRTQLYQLPATFHNTVEISFHLWYQVHTQEQPDYADVIGDFDFGNTVSLERIEVVDENGQEVFGWTVTSDSGTVYEPTLFRSGFDSNSEPESVDRSAAALACKNMYRVQRDGEVLRRVPVCKRGSDETVRSLVLQPR